MIFVMEESCLFKFRYGRECDDGKRCSSNQGRARVDSIIKASKVYGDNLHLKLEQELSENERLTVYYHKNCVSRYTSKSNTAKYQTSPSSVNPPTKKLRYSHTPFDIMNHCLYCGELCELMKDKKHPDRWRPAYMCRSTVSERDKTPYKEYILDKCKTRNDDWANEVSHRVLGVVSDLHAAEARYHRDCMSRFFANRKQKTVEQEDKPQAKHTENAPDLALQHLVRSTSENKTCIWNSVELFLEYQNHGGTALNRSELVNKLLSHFQGELLVLSSPGYANIVAFKDNAALLLKLVKLDEADDTENSIKKVAKSVIKESKAISLDRTKYQLNIDRVVAGEAVSETFQSLLAAISPKLKDSLPALLIGNIVTSMVRNQPTDLQIAIGVLLRHSKKILGYLYDFGVTCSYHEVQCFKKSAAIAAGNDPSIHGISNLDSGLVQIVVDNFDTDIYSPNGKKSTHSLAMILTQPNCTDEEDDVETIPRLTHAEAKAATHIDPADDIIPRYVSQKKTPMPYVPRSALPDDFSTTQTISSNRACELDFLFFKDIQKLNCPEYNGYNTKVCREQGHNLQPKTKVVYLPLIDEAPADPATIMTSMLKAKALTEHSGQTYVVFTADQQLYRVALHVLWENQDIFSHFYLRLGGMHLLMSYVGCIGTLMADSGMVEVLSSAFGGVLKMLTGKKFPENVRALRMLVEELLKPIFDNHNLECMADLTELLDATAARNRTAKLWINCLIYPVFTIMKYVRAEREADWPLHLASVREMMPLFFAASHINYARYGMYYLRSMEAMPDEVREHFMKGQHTMHHQPGLFNGIWSDMMIETTYMRHGHGQDGIVGITLRPETLKTWALSLHTCNKIVRGLEAMRDHEFHTSQTHHKEEMEARIKSDREDRVHLREKLDVCIDPFQVDLLQEGLVNIVTGKVVAHSSLNVDKAVEFGTNQMESFENGWPHTFHATIPKCVTTMTISRKHVKVGDHRMLDTEMIYARAMALQCSLRNFDMNNLMAHELSPKPSSMFDDCGHMKEAKTKSTLKNSLKVEVSSRHMNFDALFLDGCAVMWVVPWPAGGKVQDYLNNFRHYVQGYLQTSDVYLAFDRYNQGSTKESTRIERDRGASREYSLRPTTKLPQQKVLLTVSSNKKQLITLILDDLVSHKDSFRSKLIVTGNDPTPVEISQGTVTRRGDMRITHEEADTIIIQQVAASGASEVLVVADDTDIFVMLCHFVSQSDITGHVMMVSPVKGRSFIDINASVDRNRSVMSNLLAAHGVTGCDTVATYHGIGKGVALKVLRSNKHTLSSVGDVNSSVEEAVEQATKFILSCYGHPECGSMTEARQKIWSTKVSRSIAGAPKLQSLPPTNEAFRENVARAHLQVAIWRQALQSDRPDLDPLQHGWERQTGSPALTPTTFPENVAAAPPELLQLIKCSCDSDMPCRTKRCGCYNAGMACTMFCNCDGGQGCFNEKTRECLQAEAIDEDDD